ECEREHDAGRCGSGYHVRPPRIVVCFRAGLGWIGAALNIADDVTGPGAVAVIGAGAGATLDFMVAADGVAEPGVAAESGASAAGAAAATGARGGASWTPSVAAASAAVPGARVERGAAPAASGAGPASSFWIVIDPTVPISAVLLVAVSLMISLGSTVVSPLIVTENAWLVTPAAKFRVCDAAT